MSISYQAKDEKVLAVALKMQELCVTKKESIVDASGADLLIKVGEQVEEVRFVSKLVEAGTITGVARASISVVSRDSVALPDDKSVIKLTGVTLAADADAIVVKYSAKE